MNLYPESSYAVYELDPSPPALFGQVYVVAAGIHTSGTHYKGEYFVIVQRPTPSIHYDSFRLSSQNIPADVLTVNVSFMLDESLSQAKLHLLDLLTKRSNDLKRPDLLALRIELRKCNTNPFPGCWLRGDLHQQIEQVADATECESLYNYLAGVRTLGGLVRKAP